MTDLLPGGELPRRTFLKAGGALLVGLTSAPSVFGQQFVAASIGANAGGAQPSADRLDTWVAIHADNTATIFIGHHELGQGISTSLLQIAAEEQGFVQPDAFVSMVYATV